MLKKINLLSVLLGILLVISVVMVSLFYFAGETNGMPDYTESYILWSYTLFGIAILITVTFPVIQMASNPKGALKTIFSIVIILAITAVAYTMASDKELVLQGYTGADNVTSTLKQTGTGLYLTYILFGLAILSIIASEIRGLIK